MAPAPTVLFPLTLPGLLDYILTTQPTRSTVLIVCSSRDAFLSELSRSLRDGETGEHRRSLRNLLAPTLYNLHTTRHVKLAFCPSVQTLLAYLTTYGRSATEQVGTTGELQRLVLVNPLALHAPTPSFSAQGLSKTFATAVETALRTKVELMVVECQQRERRTLTHMELEFEEEDSITEDRFDNDRAEVEAQDPWEQEVSILNVSARRFGSGSGDRAWAGRTVKAKRIAGRWFRFHEYDHDLTRQSAG